MFATFKSFVRAIAILATLLLPAASALPTTTNNDLQKCEFDTEVQFYTADIDVLDLPEACHEENELATIGFLIQVSPAERHVNVVYACFCSIHTHVLIR